MRKRPSVEPQGMFTGNRDEDYPLALLQVRSLWEADLPLATNLANISALLKQVLERTNWAGFYLQNRGSSQLILGPFQGLPACTRIDVGKGVCGTAASSRMTQLVPDVHLFPGHIACDSASQSEIVVPLVRNGEVLGVLDVDSPEKSRFDAADKTFLEGVAVELIRLWPA